MKSMWRIRWKNTDGRFWTVFVSVDEDGNIDSGPSKLFPEWIGESFAKIVHDLYQVSRNDMTCKPVDDASRLKIVHVNGDSHNLVIDEMEQA